MAEQDLPQDQQEARPRTGFGPVVLAIDDLHWLDAPSAGALEFALRRLRDEPIAVLAANRIPQRPALDLFR